MEVIYYIIFFFVSWFGLMLIFSFSTYHKFWFWALPGVAAYSVLLGFLLDYFGLHGGFLWHLGISLFLLVKNFFKQKNQIKVIMELTEEKSQMRAMSESGMNTLTFYLISSLIYLVSFSVSYLYFFNKHFKV